MGDQSRTTPRKSLCGTEGEFFPFAGSSFVKHAMAYRRPAGTEPAAAFPSPRSSVPAAPALNTPTAQDLLRNLMIDPGAYQEPVPSPAPAQYNAVRQHPPAPHPSGQTSPAMLFGGDVTGSSIWAMTREESGRGTQRMPSNAANLASIWGAPGSTPPPAHGLPGQSVWQNNNQNGRPGSEGHVGSGSPFGGGGAPNAVGSAGTWAGQQWHGGHQLR